MAHIPLLVSLFLTFALSVTGFALGIHALISSMHDKDRLKKLSVPGTTVTINTNDVLDAGYVLTAGLGLTFVVALAGMLGAARHSSASSATHRPNAILRFLGPALAFCSVWLFATLIPVTTFVANRSAKVAAYAGSTKLPDSFVDGTIKALGISTRYNSFGYLKLLAIVPWFAFLLAVISTIIAFLARRSAGRSAARHEEKI